MIPSRRVTIWQCTDDCCSSKPFHKRWWNFSTSPGDYKSVSSWDSALRISLKRAGRS